MVCNLGLAKLKGVRHNDILSDYGPITGSFSQPGQAS